MISEMLLVVAENPWQRKVIHVMEGQEQSEDMLEFYRFSVLRAGIRHTMYVCMYKHMFVYVWIYVCMHICMYIERDRT